MIGYTYACSDGTIFSIVERHRTDAKAFMYLEELGLISLINCFQLPSNKATLTRCNWVC